MAGTLYKKTLTSYFTGAILLSVEEANLLTEEQRICTYNGEACHWWLRTPAQNPAIIVAAVLENGEVKEDPGFWADNVNIGVRPALLLSSTGAEALDVGDKFKLDSYVPDGDGSKSISCVFTVISDDYALCDEAIAKKQFDSNGADYENSDIKEYLDNWYDTIEPVTDESEEATEETESDESEEATEETESDESEETEDEFTLIINLECVSKGLTEIPFITNRPGAKVYLDVNEEEIEGTADENGECTITLNKELEVGDEIWAQAVVLEGDANKDILNIKETSNIIEFTITDDGEENSEENSEEEVVDISAKILAFEKKIGESFSSEYPTGGSRADATCTGYTIPNSVTSLGDYCFFECTNLTNITIPNSVTSLGGACFCACTNLTNITIPNSVTSLGDYCFFDCTNLTNIAIPNSVTSLGNGCFQSCTSLADITIPNSVTSLDSYCFQCCTSLTDITIPNSVTSLGNDCFDGCTSLADITIPNSVTSLGSGCFQSCTSLTTLDLSNKTTEVISIGTDAFSGCESLKAIFIPAELEFEYTSSDSATDYVDKFVAIPLATPTISPCYANDTTIEGTYNIPGATIYTEDGLLSTIVDETGYWYINLEDSLIEEDTVGVYASYYDFESELATITVDYYQGDFTITLDKEPEIGDETVSGVTEPNMFVYIYVNDEGPGTQADDTGLFECDYNDVLKAGDHVVIFASDDAEQLSNTLVYDLIPTPSIIPVLAGNTNITGGKEQGADVIVIVNDKTYETESIYDGEGWCANLETELVDGDVIIAYAMINGKKSKEIEVTVGDEGGEEQPSEEETIAPPVVTAYYAGNTFFDGTFTIPGAQIMWAVNDGAKGADVVEVDSHNNWSVTLDEELEIGDIISVYAEVEEANYTTASVEYTVTEVSGGSTEENEEEDEFTLSINLSHVHEGLESIPFKVTRSAEAEDKEITVNLQVNGKDYFETVREDDECVIGLTKALEVGDEIWAQAYYQPAEGEDNILSNAIELTIEAEAEEVGGDEFTLEIMNQLEPNTEYIEFHSSIPSATVYCYVNDTGEYEMPVNDDGDLTITLDQPLAVDDIVVAVAEYTDENGVTKASNSFDIIIASSARR